MASNRSWFSLPSVGKKDDPSMRPIQSCWLVKIPVLLRHLPLIAERSHSVSRGAAARTTLRSYQLLKPAHRLIMFEYVGIEVVVFALAFLTILVLDQQPFGIEPVLDGIP
jgi:hypothetical protein